MSATLPVKRAETIVEELERMHERIARRAYEIFEGHAHECGHELEDWLAAESELVWAPPVEVEEGDSQLTVKLAAPGMDANDLDVEVTPEDLLVQGESHEERKTKRGRARVREQTSARLFRSVHFPKKIDPASAKAELKDGMIELTARLAKEPRSARKLRVAGA